MSKQLIFKVIIQILVLVLTCLPCAGQDAPKDLPVSLQVLGSGGPELDDGRASSGYLIWVGERAHVLVDAGPGTALNYDRSGAQLSDLDAILLSHLHVDHCGDLAAFVKGLFFADRDRPLRILGPESGRWFPSTEEFVSKLFAETDSAFPYLSDFLQPSEISALQPSSVPTHWSGTVAEDVRVESRSVIHGNVPALAWRVEVAGKSLVFSGDFSGDSKQLEFLAKNCDILICHNAVPESASGLARRLHAPPSVIGRVAQKSGARRLVLSHRMKRSSSEVETLEQIRKFYDGPVDFAEDMSRFELE